MKTKRISMCFLFFLGFLVCKAQTVNIGQLYVGPNTLLSVQSDFDNKGTGEYVNNGEVLFRGSFNNDGITTFDSAYPGYTRFEGLNNQNITGDILSEFNNVLFSNANVTPAFSLYAGISISGEAEFSKGIVNSDDFGGSVLFDKTGSNKGSSSNSFVDGEVVKLGADEFFYPLGDKDIYRFAIMSAPNDEAADFEWKYFYENTDLLYPHTSKEGKITVIDDKEHWRIKKIKSSNDVLVTLSWDERTTPADIYSGRPEDEIHIVRWDETKKLWVDEGGVVDKSNNSVVTTSVVEEYGVFTLARVLIGDSNDGDVVVYNGITPNGDGHNDYFFIDGINKYPKNKVKIFNRWGVKVFETENYDSSGNVFTGLSDGRATVNMNQGLPSGTYFYSLEYEKGTNPKTVKKAGYLYIKNAE